MGKMLAYGCRIGCGPTARAGTAGHGLLLLALAVVPVAAAAAGQAGTTQGVPAERGSSARTGTMRAGALVIDVSELARVTGVATATEPLGHVAQAAGDAGGLGWREAMVMAVGRYPTITSALGTLAQQADLVDVAQAGYKPRLRADVTAGDQGEYGSGQVATVGLSQMLYDFGKTRSAVDREDAGVRREQAMVLQAIDEVVAQTGLALVEVHRYQELRQSAHARIEALRKVQEITELRAAAGAATRSDPLQARSRVESAQAHLLDVEAQLAQWRGRLRTYLGPAAPLVVAAAPLAMVEHETVGIGEEELRRLPAILAAEAERAMAEAEMRNANAQRYPTISFEANANTRLGPAGDRYGEIYGKSTYGTAFVSLSSSLYQGGAIAAQARAGANALAAAESRLEAERLAALDDLQRYHERALGERGRLGVLEQRVDSITRTRELYWDQYLSLGKRNVLDLLNAELEIGQSADDLINARHELWNAQLGWLVAAGKARQAFGLDNARVQGAELLP